MLDYSPQQYANLLSGNVAFLALSSTRQGPAGEVVEIALVSASGGVIVNQVITPLHGIPPDCPALIRIKSHVGEQVVKWPDIHRAVVDTIKGASIFSLDPGGDSAMIAQTARLFGLVPAFFQYEIRTKMIPLPARSGFHIHEFGMSPAEVAGQMVVQVKNFSEKRKYA